MIQPVAAEHCDSASMALGIRDAVDFDTPYPASEGNGVDKGLDTRPVVTRPLGSDTANLPDG